MQKPGQTRPAGGRCSRSQEQTLGRFLASPLSCTRGLGHVARGATSVQRAAHPSQGHVRAFACPGMLSAKARPLQAHLDEHVTEFRKVTADAERLKAQTQAAERKLADQVCSLG